MTTPAAITPEARQAATAADEMHAQALAHRVTDLDTADQAGAALRIVKERAKRIDETRKAMTRPLDAAKRAIMDFFKPAEAKLAEAEAHLKREVLRWQQAEEKAKREREEAEARAAEAARREAEAAEAEALDLASQGGDLAAITSALDRSEAAKSRADHSTVSAVIAETSSTRAAGVTTRARWRVQSIDLAALVKAAAADASLLAYLLPNESALRKHATEAKAAASLPGVIFAEERIAAVR